MKGKRMFRRWKRNGPTSVFIVKKDRKSEEKKKRFQELLKLVRENAVPRKAPLTTEEMMEHLITFYEAVEIPASPGQIWAMKRNVISNFFPEILPFPVRPPKGAGKKELLTWAEQEEKENGAFIDRLSPDELGLVLHVFRIPEQKKQEYWEEEDQTDQDLLIEWEERTGHMTVSGPGCRKLGDELILWKGVTKEDLEKETPVFYSYAAALRDSGRLDRGELPW